MNIELNIDEVNQVLKHLGQASYGEVFGVIGNIQRQAQQQMQEENEKTNLKEVKS